MVSNASALGRNGIQDWLLVRVSAVIIFLYTLYIIGFLLTSETLTYDLWRAFFASSVTKIATLLTLLSILIHGWIGIWQVLTDYVKPVAIRVILQFFFVLVLLSYALYGLVVVWGV